MSEKIVDSIYWVEIEKISPNPYQPRKEFDQAKLAGLADSIRQYGILQPLVVTKKETEREDGGLSVNYELIAGERRLRASKIANLEQVPVIIRNDEETNQMKLELAIIENLQREDLNAIDRAVAFDQLAREFKFKHAQIALKVGKSREYVSNTLRLLGLPHNMQKSMSAGEISEGHGRPLLMLGDRPEEQVVLFKEITAKKLTVREAEAIARRIAVEKVRKKPRAYDPEIVNLEQQLTESLGTRVQIESREVGGKIVIDFFSNDNLRNLLETLNNENEEQRSVPNAGIGSELSGGDGEFGLEEKNISEGNINLEEPESGFSEPVEVNNAISTEQEAYLSDEVQMSEEEIKFLQQSKLNKKPEESSATEAPISEEPQIEKDEVIEENSSEDEDDELYSIKNFSV